MDYLFVCLVSIVQRDIHMYNCTRTVEHVSLLNVILNLLNCTRTLVQSYCQRQITQLQYLHDYKCCNKFYRVKTKRANFTSKF